METIEVTDIDSDDDTIVEIESNIKVKAIKSKIQEWLPDFQKQEESNKNDTNNSNAILIYTIIPTTKYHIVLITTLTHHKT